MLYTILYFFIYLFLATVEIAPNQLLPGPPKPHKRDLVTAGTLLTGTSSMSIMHTFFFHPVLIDYIFFSCLYSITIHSQITDPDYLQFLEKQAHPELDSLPALANKTEENDPGLFSHYFFLIYILKLSLFLNHMYYSFAYFSHTNIFLYVYYHILFSLIILSRVYSLSSLY